MRNKISIYKQYTYFALLIPALILVAGIAIGFFNYQIVKKDRELIYMNYASRIDSVIETIFQYITIFSEIVGEKILVEPVLTTKKIGEILKETYKIAEISQDIGALTKFDFVTPDGKVVANVTQGALRTPLFVKKDEREWMTLAPEQPWRLHVSSHIVKGIIQKGLMIDYGIPVGFGIANQQGKFLGTVSSGVDIDKLARKITNSLNSESAKFIVLNDTFEIIVQSNSKSQSSFEEKEKLRTLINLKKDEILSTPIQHDGGEYYVYKHIENFPVIILVGESKDILAHEYNKKVVLPAMVSMLLGGLILILFHYFRNKIIKPVKELSELADEIAEGKFDADIPRYAYIEIRNLAGNIRKIKDYAVEINKIKKELEATTLRLKESNSILEQKVDERTKELQDALDTKKRVLNNVSHEVRTPLHAILNLSSALIEQWGKLSEQEKLQYHHMLYDSSLRLEELVSNILDLSAAENHQFQLYITKFNIVSLAKETINQCKGIALGLRKEIHYNIKIQEGLLLEIQGDRRKIKQVFYNFLSNAIKYGHEQNEIEISIMYSEEDRVLTLGVKDTGIGIPNEEIEKIFEVFTESSNTRSMSGGKGLGLALCKEIIKLHGGKIWASNNKDGVGSTFYFTIPQHEVSKITDNVVPNITQEYKSIQNLEARRVEDKITIMVIDDEEVIMNVVALMLNGFGYNLITMQGGRAALDFFEENNCHIDLILLDVMMPDIYGLKLLEMIKQNPALRKIPVIIQSGLHDEAEIKKALDLGAEGFISKPYNKKEMIAVITEVLAKYHVSAMRVAEVEEGV